MKKKINMKNFGAVIGMVFAFWSVFLSAVTASAHSGATLTSGSAAAASAHSEATLTEGSEAAASAQEDAQAVRLRERIEELETRAARGDGEALYHLSTLYERGYGEVAADSLRSDSLLRASARAGFVQAQSYLGFKLYKSEPDSARYWLRRAVDAGDLKAASNLAFLLLTETEPKVPTHGTNGDRLAEPKVPAHGTNGDRLAEPKVSAHETNGDRGIFSEAGLGSTGAGSAGDESAGAATVEAVELLRRAAAGGVPAAMEMLLSLDVEPYSSLKGEEALQEGLRAAKVGAHRVAFELYHRALPLARAETLLGDAYSSAKGTDYNHAKAMEHYLRGALGGDASAQFILAELLDFFPDAMNDFDSGLLDSELGTAQDWYEKASAQGVTNGREAMRRLFE